MTIEQRQVIQVALDASQKLGDSSCSIPITKQHQESDEAVVSLEVLARQAYYSGEFLNDCVIRFPDHQSNTRVACIGMYAAFKWWC